MSKTAPEEVERLVREKLAGIAKLNINPIQKRVMIEDVKQLREWLLMPEPFTRWFDENATGFQFEDIDIEASHALAEKWFDDVEIHQCYSNSRYIAMCDQNYDVYVGYIYRDDHVPRAHCWLVKDGRIVDPTLGLKSKSYYDENTKLVSTKDLTGRSQLEQPDEGWQKEIERETGEPMPPVDWSKMYKAIIGVKIPTDFMLSVTNYKETNHTGFQNNYLFEWYLINQLNKQYNEACIDGVGDVGHENFMQLFRKMVVEDKYDPKKATVCPTCQLECHKPDRVLRHMEYAHGS